LDPFGESHHKPIHPAFLQEVNWACIDKPLAPVKEKESVDGLFFGPGAHGVGEVTDDILNIRRVDQKLFN
jgi:hypothetical protein